MEAATQPKQLAGDKAQRIVEAMRASVARRGAAGSTFDHVAREAGVSRGLLHYYFGTKEKLLVEVVRRDCDVRLAALDEALEGATSAEDLLDVLVRSLETMIREDPGFIMLFFELCTLAQRNEDIAAELSELGRRTRENLAEVLAHKEQEGVVRLGAGADAVATVLFGLGDGLALRMLSEPELDVRPVIKAGLIAARALVSDPD